MAAPPRRGARARPQDDATPAGNIPTANHPRSLQGVGAQTAPQRRIQRRPSPKQQKIILMGHLQHEGAQLAAHEPALRHAARTHFPAPKTWLRRLGKAWRRSQGL